MNATERYDEVEDLVHEITHRFLKSKGVSESDYEEWHGESCLAFVRSCGTFDPDFGCRFSTHLWHRVWYALCNKLGDEAPHWTTPHLESDPESREEAENIPCFDARNRWAEELSDDALAVVGIVLSSCMVDERQRSPCEIRLLLHDLLLGLGWSFRRIVETFHEIKTVLTEGD